MPEFDFLSAIVRIKVPQADFKKVIQQLTRVENLIQRLNTTISLNISSGQSIVKIANQTAFAASQEAAARARSAESAKELARSVERAQKATKSQAGTRKRVQKSTQKLASGEILTPQEKERAIRIERQFNLEKRSQQLERKKRQEEREAIKQKIADQKALERTQIASIAKIRRIASQRLVANVSLQPLVAQLNTLRRSGLQVNSFFTRLRNSFAQVGRQSRQLSSILSINTIKMIAIGAAAKAASVSIRAIGSAIRSVASFGLSGFLSVFTRLAGVIASVPLKAFNLGLKTIRGTIATLFSPILGIVGIFRFLSRSIVPFIGFGLITAGITSVIREFVAFENAIGRASGVLVAGSNNFEKDFRSTFNALGKEVRDVAERTLFTASEVADTALAIVKGGVQDLGKVIAGLEPAVNLGIVGNLDAERAAQAITIVANNFEKLPKDFDDVADAIARTATITVGTVDDVLTSVKNLGKTATIAGISLEEALAITSQLLKGAQASTTGTALSRGILRFLKPTKEGEKRIRQLIKEFNRLNNAGLKLEDFFDTAGQKFRDLSGLITVLERSGGSAQDLLTIFGFRTRTLVNLLSNELPEGIDQSNLSLGKLGDALRKIQAAGPQDFAKQLADAIGSRTLGGSLRLLNSALQELSFSVFEKANESVRGFILSLRNSVRRAARDFKRLEAVDEVINSIVASLRGAIKDIGPVVGRLARLIAIINVSAFLIAVEGLRKAFRALSDSAQSLIDNLAGFLNIPTIALDSWSSTFQGIARLIVNADNLFNAFILSAEIRLREFQLNFLRILSTPFTFDTRITESLVDAFNTIIPLLTKAITTAIHNGITSVFDSFRGQTFTIGGLDVRIPTLSEGLEFAEKRARSLREEIKNLGFQIDANNSRTGKFLTKLTPFLPDNTNKFVERRDRLKERLKETETQINNFKSRITRKNEVPFLIAEQQKLTSEARKIQNVLSLFDEISGRKKFDLRFGESIKDVESRLGRVNMLIGLNRQRLLELSLQPLVSREAATEAGNAIESLIQSVAARFKINIINEGSLEDNIKRLKSELEKIKFRELSKEEKDLVEKIRSEAESLQTAARAIADIDRGGGLKGEFSTRILGLEEFQKFLATGNLDAESLSEQKRQTEKLTNIDRNINIIKNRFAIEGANPNSFSAGIGIRGF